MYSHKHNICITQIVIELNHTNAHIHLNLHMTHIDKHIHNITTHAHVTRNAHTHMYVYIYN